ncbi:MAG: HEAT repeat domain-containing protein, partial [Acidobacteriota bacterium]
KILLLTGSESVIALLGEILDSGQEVEEKVFENFVKYLDRNAIVPFMKILGELKSIHARKVVIDALIVLGTKDIATLSKGLNDSRWYVVRNIIYILRKIGDRKAVDYLLKTVRHGDIRVKKEVIRALGELGGAGVLQSLRDCLDDTDHQVRSAALKALGNIKSEAAKRIIMNKVADKYFRDKEFDEKKEYFEVLSHWKDGEVYNSAVSIIKRKTFLGRAKNYENRACAAYCLGLLGNKDALPLLNKYKNDGNKLLREFVHSAIKRIEYGQ